MAPTFAFPPGRLTLLLAVTTAVLFIAIGAAANAGRLTAPPVRTIALGGAPKAVALDSHGDRAFVLGDDATVWLVDLAHAHIVRTLAGDGAIRARLALDARTQRLFVVDPRDGLNPGVVRMLDSRSGALLATVRVGVGADAIAVDERGSQVFVANQRDSTLSVLDARSAKVQRTIRVASAPVALAVDARAERAFVLSYGFEPAYGPGPNLLQIIDTRRDTLLRTVWVGLRGAALAVDARTARLFVTSYGAGSVSVLDAHDGMLLRTVEVGGLPSAPVVDERRARVYVADAGAGTLCLLDAATGALLRMLRLHRSTASAFALPVALAVDDARDRVYLSTWGPLAPTATGLTLRGAGTLYVLDARTLALRARLSAGVAPQALAVEARRGRVVVVDSGGAVRLPAANDWLAQGVRWLQGLWPWLWRSVPPPTDVTVAPGGVRVLDVGTVN